jgi:hypothetical protein
MELEKTSKVSIVPLPGRDRHGHEEKRISLDKAKDINNKLKCENKGQYSTASQHTQSLISSLRRENVNGLSAGTSSVSSVQIEKLAVDLDVAPRFGVNAKALILQAASNLAGSRSKLFPLLRSVLGIGRNTNVIMHLY